MEIEHTSDSEFVKTFGLVMGALVLFFFFVLAMANLIPEPANTGPNSAKMAAIDARIAPVGSVRTSAEDLDVAPVAAAESLTPEQLVQTNCIACHGAATAAALGAPAIGDAAAWSDRLGKGLDTLVSNAINGINTMPPRGGSSLSDDDMRSAVEFMTGN